MELIFALITPLIIWWLINFEIEYSKKKTIQEQMQHYIRVIVFSLIGIIVLVIAQ